MMNPLFVIFLAAADFPICTAESFQDHPVVKCIDNMYYVFWVDHRFYPSLTTYSVYAARVSPGGNVLDPDGKLLFCETVNSRLDVDFGISDILLVCRNGC
jgi:hypothetical protein